MRYPKKYVVFDFETTGLDHIANKVLEIGALKVVPGIPDTQFTTIINWGIEIPEKITELTGITQEMADAGMAPDEAKRVFRDFINGFPLVGHNVHNFDNKFLCQFLEYTGEEFKKLQLGFVDTAVLVKASKLGEDIRWNELFADYAERIMSQRVFGLKFNLGLCCEEYQIPNLDGQHRAMADVKLTNELYKKLCLNS